MEKTSITAITDPVDSIWFNTQIPMSYAPHWRLHSHRRTSQTWILAVIANSILAFLLSPCNNHPQRSTSLHFRRETTLSSPTAPTSPYCQFSNSILYLSILQPRHMLRIKGASAIFHRAILASYIVYHRDISSTCLITMTNGDGARDKN
jgi:hypothetical protein